MEPLVVLVDRVNQALEPEVGTVLHLHSRVNILPKEIPPPLENHFQLWRGTTALDHRISGNFHKNREKEKGGFTRIYAPAFTTSGPVAMFLK